jgi:hypothetical protein
VHARPLSPYYHHVQSCSVDAPAERADTLPLFHLYPYMYSVFEPSLNRPLLIYVHYSKITLYSMQTSVSFLDDLCPPRKPLQQIPPLLHPTLRFNAPETRIVRGGHGRPVGRLGRDAGPGEGRPPAHQLAADQQVLLTGEKVEDGQAGEQVEHVVCVASAQPLAKKKVNKIRTFIPLNTQCKGMNWYSRQI